MKAWGFELEDNVAIERIASGDTAALAELYDRYGRISYGLAYRILSDGQAAEEVVQDAFMQVWKRASTFDPNRGAGVRSWLLTIVHNRAIDQVRRQSKRASREVELNVEAAFPGDPDPVDSVISSLDGEQVRAALNALPADQRGAIELAYFHDLTQQEIATRLDIPLGTVKSRVRLGLKKLYSLLDEQQVLDVGT